MTWEGATCDMGGATCDMGGCYMTWEGATYDMLYPFRCPPCVIR